MHLPYLAVLSFRVLLFDLRCSFMTGRAPDKTRVWNFINDFRQGGSADGVPGEEWVTMPEFFKMHNYTTLGHGKLYHVSCVVVDLLER